jgi:hypothetical protein
MFSMEVRWLMPSPIPLRKAATSPCKKNMVGIHQNQCSPVRSLKIDAMKQLPSHTYMADLGTFDTIPFPFE